MEHVACMSKMKKCGLNLLGALEEKRFAARRYIEKVEMKLRGVKCDHLYRLELSVIICTGWS